MRFEKLRVCACFFTCVLGQVPLNCTVGTVFSLKNYFVRIKKNVNGELIGLNHEVLIILNSLLLLCLGIIPKLNDTNTPHAHGNP